jgi:hypothetical protein
MGPHLLGHVVTHVVSHLLRMLGWWLVALLSRMLELL